MDTNNLPPLKVDALFQRLIRPAKKKDLAKLERSLVAEGCKSPISVWKGTIVDGHKRYEICRRKGISFTTMEMPFACRESAIAWICQQQLERKDLTDEYRKYLIGVRYESEKIANLPMYKANRFRGRNLPLEGLDALQDQEGPPEPFRHITAQKIADQYHVSFGTVQKYAAYARAVNTLGEKAPELPPRILAGKYKVSHRSILELAELTPGQIQRIASKVELNQQPFTQYSKLRVGLQEQAASQTSTAPNSANTPSIKDMPAYDPDAEITGLALTIPSWVSSIERVRDKADFATTSEKARSNLLSSLVDLQLKVALLLSKIREE